MCVPVVGPGRGHEANVPKVAHDFGPTSVAKDPL